MEFLYCILRCNAMMPYSCKKKKLEKLRKLNKGFLLLLRNEPKPARFIVIFIQLSTLSLSKEKPNLSSNLYM